MMHYIQSVTLILMGFFLSVDTSKHTAVSSYADPKEYVKRGSNIYDFTLEIEDLQYRLYNSDSTLLRIHQENAMLENQINMARTGDRSVKYKIAFMGVSTQSFTGAKVVSFNVIQTNEGGAFSHNGRFTAPVKGVYYFDFHGLKQLSTSYSGMVQLRRNGNRITSSYAYQPYISGHYALVLSATLSLNANDYIDIYINSASYRVYSTGNKFMSFSGGLLYPL